MQKLYHMAMAEENLTAGSKEGRTEALNKIVEKFRYQPISADEARSQGIDSGSLHSRMVSIRNDEVVGDYFVMRKSAVESGKTGPNGYFPEGSLKAPEILDNNQLDAGVLAYLKTREAHLTLKARELAHKGRMGNVEEHEAMRVGIAIRVLTGENTDSDHTRFLAEQMDKMKQEAMDSYWLDPRMKEEKRVLGEYYDKIKQNVTTRFAPKRSLFEL